MEKLRIFLADDHVMLRNGLRPLINAQPDMVVIGEAGDGRSTVKLVLEFRPDVAIVDVSMPELNGQQTTRQLKRMRPETKILALTRHVEGCYLQQLFRAGASGYVLKQNDAQELIRAIRVVASGGVYVDPALAGALISVCDGRFRSRDIKEVPPLTDRETEVLRLIAQGYSNKEIAAFFDLSVKTVEVHKANAMRKLRLSGRIEIMRYAVIQGWLQDL
jgi:two-component system, NarL family, response regulator NreC